MDKPLLVKDVSGLAVISGFGSRIRALQLCDRFQNLGVKTEVSAVEKGFEVLVFTLSAQDVLTLLGEFGIDAASAH